VTPAATATADLPKPLSADGTEHFVEPDELAIYGWINPTKGPEEVKRERHRMVAFQAIRYGIHHYLDDIWQEWQLAVHQRAQTAPPVPVEQREVFSFGIARNLCRAYLRKDRRMVPLLDPSAPPDEGATGIRERELVNRRADRPGEPINKPTEPEVISGAWDHTENLNHCIGKLQPREQQVLRKTYVDGKSSHEVGMEMGLSPENVRQQLHRARDELRHCMAVRRGRS
jgi:RNA polymerase sigma factor (sigma-70 family)